jgi:hypothetical protein
VYKIKAYKNNQYNGSIIKQSNIRREWMDKTYNSHAYHCFPISLTNTLGWSISFPEEISFIWDGYKDFKSTKNEYGDPDIKILSGEKYVNTLRNNGTISFKTGISLKTEKNLSMLVMPVPNYFLSGAQAFTTIISTSFYKGDIEVVWKVTQPNLKITIPAFVPVANLLPISLTDINESEIIFQNKDLADKHFTSSCSEEKNNAIRKEKIEKGDWSNFYKNATDACGNRLGKHEVEKLILRTTDA